MKTGIPYKIKIQIFYHHKELVGKHISLWNIRLYLKFLKFFVYNLIVNMTLINCITFFTKDYPHNIKFLQ